MADAWGGSWGTSWGASWGTAPSPPSPPSADVTGGWGGGGNFYEHPARTYERYLGRLKKRQRALYEAETEPEQVEAIEAAEEAVEEIKEQAPVIVPQIPAFDYGPIHSRLAAAQSAIAAIEAAIQAEMRRRERVRRNNNWLMMQ